MFLKTPPTKPPMQGNLKIVLTGYNLNNNKIRTTLCVTDFLSQAIVIWENRRGTFQA